MRIKRIYIKDFGIFRDEKLDNLNGNIVVIGGHNRAGKSSFMELLRHLGFGFLSNNRELPPPNVEYGVNYDVETEEGEIFNIDIKGNKNPVVKGLNVNRQISIQNIYSNVDYFKYKQLFTISLDELQNTGLKNSKEINNMQTIFLGAGFKEIAQVPQILKEIQKEAIKIGGKNGNSSTAQFKEYNKSIKKGIELREKAISEVEEYYDKSKELEKVNKQISEEEDMIQNLEKRINILQIIKSNFSSYEKLKEIQLKLNIFEEENDIKDFKYQAIERVISLKEEYEDVLYEYEQSDFKFKQNTGGHKSLREKLINYKDKIKYFYNNISGMTEKIKNYKELKENCLQEREEIIKEIRNINEEWSDDFNKVLSIKTDIINIEDINNTIDKYNQLMYEKNMIENELKSLKVNKKVIEKTNSKNVYFNIDEFIKRYFYISLMIIILGVVLSFINYYKAGIILAMSGTILGGIYGVIKYISYTVSGDSSDDLRNGIENIKDELNEKNKLYEEVCKKAENNNKKIQGYRSLLNLQVEVSGDMLKEYFRRVKELKSRIINLQGMVSKASKAGNVVNNELNSMLNIVCQFRKTIYKEEIDAVGKSLIKNSDKLFNMIEILNDYVDFSEELQLVQYRKDLLEKKIYETIGEEYNKEDILRVLEEYIEMNKRYKEVLELKSEQEILEKTLKNYCEYDGNYKNIFEKYKLYSEVDEEYDTVEKEFKNIRKELENLKEKRQSLKYELDILKTTENIENAEQYIDNGRKGLRPLAKKYASLKAAEYILRKLQNHFIENTKDSLLRGASEYLSQITEGEYKSILPPEDLSSLEFKTTLEDGNIHHNPEVLSRATKEQLFLAVRLSRIKEINPPLPIILDDSFVNFDEKHTKQVMKILLEISKTNQIFLTTCHPQLLEYIHEVSKDVQYWNLEKGRFTLCDKDSLIKYLV
ncbi:ATP-binding protein [Clostridium ganghwense]|uniref:AAA family ATPase n=1 Tax=Clostridium ganghwense TaxID=312089 RepID=A0ABT4CR13_9CLOT|nr:AAA family ATPase [Clostridium ganghwense]MCY6370873.1 AAA family ATPase [Clostridium ganghwense]